MSAVEQHNLEQEPDESWNQSQDGHVDADVRKFESEGGGTDHPKDPRGADC
jgi:hypothetical protein